MGCSHVCMLILVSIIIDVVLTIEDPYVTLGLTKKATFKEIKRAYKNLAREWHPDKNESPKAHEKFMSITQAYETLSDPLKKDRYDKYGTFDEPQEGFRHSSHFEDFFGFGFGGFDNGNSFFQKHRISMRMFSHSLLDKSFSQPILIFAYSGYCQLCFRLEPIWQSVVEDLEPLGYGIGTVNAITDGNLLEKLRVSRLPSIVVVVEGRVIHYRGSMHPISAKSLRVFARDVIPSTFVLQITNHDGLRRFVDQWKNFNKISVLILGGKEDPRIRYVLTAMKYSTFARFAYVHLNGHSDEVAKMRDALGVRCANCESILVFNDFPENGPVAQLSMSAGNQLSVEEIGTLIETNKHLVFPRLASQAHLDDLCPVSSRNARKICVILTVVDSSADQSYVNTMRDYVNTQGTLHAQQRVQFAYMFVDKQKDFIVPFVEGISNEDHTTQGAGRDVVVIWRLEHNRARFAWLRGVWDASSDSSLNVSGEQLRTRLELIVQGTSKLDHQADLGTLVDEFRPSMFTRMARAAMRMCESAWFHLSKEETLPVLSAVGTFLVILLVGYGLNYATLADERSRGMRQEKRKPPSGDSDEQWHPDDPQTEHQHNTSNRSSASARERRIMREMTPLMHELRAETYFGMIRLLKPGCRSLVVLVDEQSKDVLLPQFAKHVWPIRNNKTFSFGYLMIPKNLQWFRKLLEYTLPVEKNENKDDREDKPVDKEAASMYERLKSINPRKTLGTVLVLCGWKLYFNMYHPMHTSLKKKNFLGFEDDGERASSEDSDSDSDSEKATLEEVQALRKGYQLKLEDVLNGLPNWLDRLFEGSIRRYYIPEWPDNLK